MAKTGKFNKERAVAILKRVLLIVGMALLFGVSAAVAGGGAAGAFGAVAGAVVGTGAGVAVGIHIAWQVPVPPKAAQQEPVAAKPADGVTVPSPQPAPEPAPTPSPSPIPAPAPIPSPSPAPPPVPAPSTPPTPAQPVTRPRYIGNSHTHEIHDTDNLSPHCRFGDIKEEHKVEFASIEAVEAAIANDGYNGCHWCLRKLDTD